MRNKKTWENVWNAFLEKQKPYDTLYDNEYIKCKDSSENYIQYYKEYYKRWPSDELLDSKEYRFLQVGRLLRYIDDKECDNNKIADLLSEILVENIEVLKDESYTRGSIVLDLCCDVFMAVDKEKAIERIAILYELLSDAANDPKYKSYYSDGDMDYVKNYVIIKWFNPDWLSNDLDQNIQYMKVAAESEKRYVKTFAKLFTSEIAEIESKLEKQGKQKKIAQRDIIIFLLGMISGILFWGCISMVIDKFNAEENKNPSQAIESQVEEDESTKDKQDQEKDTASDDKQQPTVTGGPEDSSERSGQVTKDDKDTDSNATTDISAGQDQPKNPDGQTGSEVSQGPNSTGNNSNSNSNNNNGIITNDTQEEKTVQLTSGRTIRKTASAAGEEIGKLEMGVTVTVLEQGVQQIIDEVSGYWCKVTYAGASADIECYMWIKELELAIGR